MSTTAVFLHSWSKHSFLLNQKIPKTLLWLLPSWSLLTPLGLQCATLDDEGIACVQRSLENQHNSPHN